MPHDLPDPNARRTLYYESRLAEIKRSVGAEMREANLARLAPRTPTPLSRLLKALTGIFKGS
jgi:hypothetical protein